MSPTAGEETLSSHEARPRPSSPKIIINDAGRESLSNFIKRLYGEEIFRLTRRLDELRKKKSNLLSSLNFLLRCRDTGVMPKFLIIKRHFRTNQAHRIYNRMERAMLRERIHNSRKQLALIDKQLLHIHIRASNSMEKTDWDKIDSITYQSMQWKLCNNTERQKLKFNKLAPIKPTIDTSNTVVNLSKHQLTQDQTAILAKGSNFAITPKVIPVEDIIASVESAIGCLPDAEAEEVRAETSRILKKARPPRCNVKRSELSAIKELNSNEDILILPADKGNATVVMDTEDYKQKIHNMLEPDTYTRLQKDPTAKIIRQINNAIKTSSIPKETAKSIIRTEALPPRLYGLPKIHKEGVPLRPIVSAIDSPTYSLAKYLGSLLKPHIRQTDSHVRDSTHFIHRIQNISIEPGDLLVSFDVVSLFTKIPISETLDYMLEMFTKDIIDLFRLCLTTNYFLWNGEFYQQTDGVAMGSPLSPIMADFFMERFEQDAINTAPLKPKVWYRYVDDTFVIWNHGEDKLCEFLEHINSKNEKIQFTMEKENEGKLPFLDVLVIRQGQHLEHTVYRKPTHTDRYLNKTSNHHPCQKRGIIKTLTDRAHAVCQPEYLSHELNHLQMALIKNGYSEKEIKEAQQQKKKKKQPREIQPSDVPRRNAYLKYIPNTTDRIGRLLQKHNIKPIYLPTGKLQDMLRSSKDKRDPKTSGGVYRIPCSCGKVYIGTTKRSVNTRIDEHKRNCRLGQCEKSSVAEHTLENPGHNILFHETDVLSNTQQFFTRLHREAIEIHKHKNCYNKKEEALKVKKVWHQVLGKCKIKPHLQRENNTQSRNEHDNQPNGEPNADQSGSSNAAERIYKTRSQAKRLVTSL